MEKHKKRGSLVGPTILIILGIVFLLNNLGWTTISVWDLLRLWPILLIAGGLDLLIGHRSALGSVLVLVVMLAMLGGGMWLLTSSRPTDALDGVKISESVGDATQAEVHIGFGVGMLRVESMPESNKLVEGTVELHRGEELEREFKIADNTAHLQLNSKGNWSVPFFGWEGEKTWALKFNRDVPTDLEVDAGVGDVHLDLRRMNLSGLDLDLGVGRTTVILPERGDLQARVNGGVGESVIMVPTGVKVRIHSSVGLGNVSAPSSYQRLGDGYVSPGYEKAETRVDLTVEAGIGQISIREHAGE